MVAKREALRVSKPYGTTLFGRRKKIEEEEEDLKRRMSISSSIYAISPPFYVFSLFFGCISPLHELILFSRVFDVV